MTFGCANGPIEDAIGWHEKFPAQALTHLIGIRHSSGCRHQRSIRSATNRSIKNHLLTRRSESGPVQTWNRELVSRTPGAGEAFRDCSYCPATVLVPQGSYLMGTSSEEITRLGRQYSPKLLAISTPQTEVHVPDAFAVGRTHITVGDYRAFVSATGRRGNSAATSGKAARF